MPASAQPIAPPPSRAAYPHPVTADPSGPLYVHEKQRTWGGSAHNTALARAAEIEDEDAELLIDHVSDLRLSAAYLLLERGYQGRKAGDLENGEGPGLELAMFAERLFSAGCLYASSGCKRWGEAAHTVALALAEQLEGQEKDEGQDHVAELIISPMYLLAVQDYERYEKRIADGDASAGTPEFILAVFAARMFLAGTVYAKATTPVS